MKHVWKLSDYLFGWYWKKWGKVITIVSLCLGALLLAFSALPSGDPDSLEYYSMAFRSYDMILDGSFLPIVFALGLLLIFLLQFVQMKGFFHNGKGIYTLCTLPMQRREVYLSFLLSLAAAVAVYYLLWLVLLVAAYFPVTILNERAAAREIFYLSEGVTLTGLDTHIENGLFLAFRRSAFLATFFPVSLWHIPPFLVGLCLIGTALLNGCFHSQRIGTCVVVSLADILMGLYLFLATSLQREDFLYSFGNDQTLFLGRNVVLALVLLAVAVVQQVSILKHLEEEIEL